jgi:galactokinase
LTDFARLYGRAPELAADAPGRVNLIGEHTDYNGGFVLPLAIPQRTRVELARRPDRTVRAWSAQVSEETPEQAPEAYELGTEARGRGWLDYVQGVTSELLQAGHEIGGVDLRIDSRVPLGSGLSSSAALEVALLRALREAFALELDDVRLALLGQKAENNLVGAPVGVMDQMAASLADTRTALFLDTRNLRFERVPLPDEAELAVIDSGIEHQHATGGYRERRQQCEQAAELLGVGQLRELYATDLPRVARLPEPLNRRARHVVTENGRVLAAVQALRRGDLALLGKLLDAGHRSLAEDFEVSLPEIDLLARFARQQEGVYGARLTGGGFGGSVVVLARKGKARDAAEWAVAHYSDETGKDAKVLVPEEPAEE